MTETKTSVDVLSVRRYTIGTQRSFDDLVGDYERLVPTWPEKESLALARRGAPWAEMERLVKDAAPLGFLLYDRTDFGPLFAGAGDPSHGIAYLMGNHVTAETMYRHDPRVMLHVPLRVLIWETASTETFFGVEQPSSQLTQLSEGDEIEPVARFLDGKVADLLDALSLPVPRGLRN